MNVKSQARITPLVEHGFCSGCGVCAAMCPKQKLTMKLSSFGELIPEENTDILCAKNCSICVSSCPFGTNAACEDEYGNNLFSSQEGQRHQPHLGFFNSLYAGFVNDEQRRLRSPSGGIATWFLEEILTQKIVDKVVCVVPGHDSGKLFSFTMIDSAEDIAKAACSSYYPVEISEQLKEIIKHDGKYAVIALPCLAKSIRRAMAINPKLNERIKIVAGIACGTVQNALYTSFLCGLRGYPVEDVSEVNFRRKHPAASARGYSFTFKLKKEHPECHIFTSKLKGKDPWNLGFFRVSGCNYCDDVFNELADISFFDAWSPQYTRDYKGHNYVITRTRIAKEIIDSGKNSGKLILFDAGHDEVLKSQKAALRYKIDMLPLRLSNAYSSIKNKDIIPQKRVSPQSDMGFLLKLSHALQVKLALEGKKTFAAEPTPRGVRRSLQKTGILRVLHMFLQRLIRRVQ